MFVLCTNDASFSSLLQNAPNTTTDMTSLWKSPLNEWPPVVLGRLYPKGGGLFTYKFPLNVFCSGCHRVSGIALSIGVTGIAAASLLKKSPMPQFLSSILTPLPQPAICAAKWCVSFPMIVHWTSSLRYLFWSTFKSASFDTKGTTVVSAAIMASSLAASLVLSSLKFPLRPNPASQTSH